MLPIITMHTTDDIVTYHDQPDERVIMRTCREYRPDQATPVSKFLLTGTPVKMHNFSWNVAFNIAQNNSKVLQLGPDGSSIVIAGANARWGNGVRRQQCSRITPMDRSWVMATKRDAAGNKIFSDGSDQPGGCR